MIVIRSDCHNFHKEQYRRQSEIVTINIFDNLYLEIEEESADNVEDVHQGESQEQAPPLKSEKMKSW